MRTPISTKKAAAAVGPYSQGITTPQFVFASGQLPISPSDNQIPAGIEAQTRQVLSNLAEVLKAGGADLSTVTKTTVFLKNLSDFEAMNRIYGEHFASAPPARSTIEVARLPKDALVEIEAIAMVKG